MARLRFMEYGCVVALGMAAWAPPVAAQTSPAEKAVMQAIDQINSAFQHRDATAYERLITAEFVRVTSSGRAFGRAEWLKTVAAPGAERGPGTYADVSVRIYGDGAVVTYRNMPAAGNGTPGPVGWLTRILVREGTQWKMVLAQSTDLTPPSAPAGPNPMALPPWSATIAREREALAAFQAIQKANASRDIAAWERLSAPDHTIISADGTRVSRAERVAALKSPAPASGTAASPERDVRVIVKGDVAAVTWTTATSRSLKVLARRAGQWQQVLQESSPIVAGK